MSKRETQLLLEDILDAAKKIISYSNELTFDDFMGDEKTVDAVVRNFEIIGEAANRIDYEILWKIKQENIPELIGNITILLEEK